MPAEKDANLLMVGAGTGIAPFRAFVRHIYQQHGEWKGKVRLFYGAKSGVEMLYMNDFRKDLALYYDQPSFRAFEVISPRPQYDEPPELDRALIENSREIWQMVQDPKTHVYVAGLLGAAKRFELGMEKLAGSRAGWQSMKENLIAEKRYAELLYE